MHFKIAFVTATGSTQSVRVQANTKEEARDRAGINAKRIVSIQEDTGGLLGGLFNAGPPLQSQISVLAALGAAVASGKSADIEFVAQAEADPALKKRVAELRELTLTSERMRALKFDPTATMLAEVGERTQTLGESISQGAEMLSDQYKLAGVLSKGAKPQILLLLILAGVLCGMPFMFAPIFEAVDQAGGGIVVEKTFATHWLFGIKWGVQNLWPGFVFAVGVIFFTRKRIWAWLRFKPFFSTFDELDRCKRALRFTTAYLPLDKAEVPASEVLARFRDSERGLNQQIYDQMFKAVSNGHAMSTTFDETRWPAMFLRAINDIESADATQRARILEIIKRNLLLRLEITAERLVGRFKLMGWGVLITVIGLMLYGVYLPLMTMSAV
jgi:type II secretory pathway component PulF